MKKTVTRFAPSPTGVLHIGSLRTALFNYLWAKKNNGTFRLRIEDTDRERMIQGTDKKLIKLFNEIGISPDGKIIYQSKRAENGVYKKIAHQLVKDGNAYYCFCTTEKLAQSRKDQISRKEAPGYEGTCRSIAADEADSRVASGESATIRIRWKKSGEHVYADDEIHGKVAFPIDTVHDAILLKSDGFPTYHLANVVDDHEMDITHVIRGEEWLPSAPLHGLLYEYLRYDKPLFYHIPLILNPDKSKLSKRQSHVSVEWYIEQGYLKEALLNYIAFLGWNPGDEREIFSLNDLIKDFDLKNINKAGAIFSIDKLNWYNGWYIKNVLAAKPAKELSQVLKPYLSKHTDHERLGIFNLFFERIHCLAELDPISQFLWNLPAYDTEILIFKKSSKEKSIKGLTAASHYFKGFDKEWTHINLELGLKKTTEEHKLSFGDIFWPVRVALSGLTASPSPTELAAFLGPDETKVRLQSALKKLSE